MTLKFSNGVDRAILYYQCLLTSISSDGRNPLYLLIIFVAFLLTKALWVQLDVSNEFKHGVVSVFPFVNQIKSNTVASQ